MHERGHRSRTAFTLLELTIVIMVIAIVVVLTLPVISKLRARAQRAQCSANLRSLYVATELYLQQNQSWPQIRLGGTGEGDFQTYARAWIAALAPYGVQPKTWICPAMQNRLENPDYTKPENQRVDYYAMNFDDKPTTPHRWANMLWFTETHNLHGKGQLMIMSDGSIKDLETIAAGASPSPK